MEKTEPKFIPEWLKGSGGGTRSHQMLSSSPRSADHMTTNSPRNKPSASINDYDTGRSFISDRKTTTSSYFRRSSSSNDSSRSLSRGTSSRSGRDRDWEKETNDIQEKEKNFLSDHRNEYSDPLGNFLPGRFEKDLRRSQAMITGKQGETWPRKMPSYSSNVNKSSCLQTGVSALGSVHKASFERDFPSLGAEERQASEIKRTSSAGLNTAVPSLSLGTPALNRGDVWTSALAEVSGVAASNDIGSVQQVNLPSTVSMTSSIMAGLNMAETVAHGPSRAQTSPQLPAGTQRLEELAIRQSKQLIPVTPSMPKALVLNPLEKQKTKLGQQQFSSPYISNHSPRNAPATPDVLKLPTVGKLRVLKSTRERNGALPSPKDTLSPTSGRAPSTPLAVAPSIVGPAPLKSQLEKKLTPQAQSRNDFFNLMRKKSTNNPSSAAVDPGIATFHSDDSETSNSPVMPLDGDPSLLGTSFGDHLDKGSDDKGNGNSSERSAESVDEKVFESILYGKDCTSSNTILSSEEEEAAFLRSLGWEENGGEDEGLTEEEISSFYKEVDEYIKLRPPSKVLRGMQPKFLESLNLRNGSVDGGVSSAGSSSCDPDLKSQLT